MQQALSGILLGLLVNAIFEILKILALSLFPHTNPLLIYVGLSIILVVFLIVISLNQSQGNTANKPRRIGFWSGLAVFSIVSSIVGFLIVRSLLTPPPPPLKTCTIQERSIIKDQTEHPGMVITTIRTIETIHSNSIDWTTRSVDGKILKSSTSMDIKENQKMAHEVRDGKNEGGTIPFLSRAMFDGLLNDGEVRMQLIDDDVKNGKDVVLSFEQIKKISMKVNGDTVRLEVVEAITDKGDRIEILNNREYPLILLFDVRERRKVLRRTYELDGFKCSPMSLNRLGF
jgi:hypothetical protein